MWQLSDFFPLTKGYFSSMCIMLIIVNPSYLWFPYLQIIYNPQINNWGVVAVIHEHIECGENFEPPYVYIPSLS